MEFFAPLMIAVSLYSILPMKQLTWTEKRLGHVLAWFPLVGLLNAGWDILWYLGCRLMSVPPLLAAVICLTGHFVFRGAIHLDGYCDVSDAVFSRRPPEEQLKIMKDPHIGSFAVISLVFLMLLLTGFWTENMRSLAALNWLDTADSDAAAGIQPALFWLGFAVFVRALSALLILLLPAARPDGLARTLSAETAKADRYALYFWHSLSAVLMLISLPSAAVSVIVLSWILWFTLTRWCLRRFGGVTGDLAGFFLIVTELVAAAVLYLVLR